MSELIEEAEFLEWGAGFSRKHGALATLDTAGVAGPPMVEVDWRTYADLHAQVLAGDLSPHAAMIEAIAEERAGG